MRKSYSVVLLISLLVATLIIGVGCGDGSSNAQKDNGEKVTLKISHVFTTDEPVHKELVKMADRIMERSNGSIEVQVYPNSELGGNMDNLEQAAQGANVVCAVDPAQLATYAPDYAVMNGPFLFDTYKDIENLANSDWHEEMKQEASENGIKVLSQGWYWGARHLISDRVVTTPNDLKGVKVRISPVKMWAETMGAMGAVATPLEWSEVYSALSQGVVEGAEAPLATIYGSKLHETVNQIALTGHFMGLTGLSMSQQVFDSMTEEQQKILQEEVDCVGAIISDICAEEEKVWKKKLEDEGVIFNEVDKEAFREATKIVYTKFPEWSPGLYERVTDILNK